MNAATMTPADAFTWAVMCATALRIARTSISDPDSARADYEAHSLSMDADELEMFDKVIVGFIIQEGKG